jgi:hypothetical protein
MNEVDRKKTSRPILMYCPDSDWRHARKPQKVSDRTIRVSVQIRTGTSRIQARIATFRANPLGELNVNALHRDDVHLDVGVKKVLEKIDQ